MTMDSLENRIDDWRTAVLRGRAVTESDADELEGHLREQVIDLQSSGLTGDEAFLIAVRRLGQVDTLTAEFAREHSDRLWKHLALPISTGMREPSLLVMLGFAVLAGGLVLAATLIASSTKGEFSWFARDVSLFVLPVLAAYFALLRRMPLPRVMAYASVVALLAVTVNVYPFVFGGATSNLVVLHLPFALWFIVGGAYLGGEFRSSARRMDFLRFSGEWAIYYTLIALGGAVLLGLTTLILTPIAPEVTGIVSTNILPVGAAGGVVVAAWLVEAKKSIIENLAPVLTAIFTPLFAIMLVVAVVAYAVSGVWRTFDRQLLTGFDALLLVVIALVVYGISARTAAMSPGVMDVIRLIAVAAAVILDALVLYSMFTRIGELGFTANRVAALGLNAILLVNLVVSAWLLARLLAGRAPVVRLERWQTGYLPVFAVWIAVVLLALPPIFGFA
ncbi:MAG: permease prefix domain 1-containing protein [Terrimesophilobacter sp.]